ncbi:MAG TPA: hypothetical protein VGM06_09485 [Polyangiaceae bacterium]
MKALRSSWVVLMGIASAILVPTALPYVAWRLEKAKTLDVVIVDKTAPFRNYREHAAIPWLLHAMKLKSRTGRFLDPALDYVGYDPVDKRGHDLTEHDLAGADVLVIADTYGVYVGDYQRPGEQAALERSPKIYGGLAIEEATAITAFAARGGTIIGEFNAFASPTDDAARAKMEALFGVRWTHWVARYWPNLQDANEVPKWIGRIYERVYHHPFDLRGGGLVFVHEDSDIVVLRDDDDLRSGVLSQERTRGGTVFDLPDRGAFAYWLDVVESTASEVLYEHVVDTTKAGEETLIAHGLSRRFPAVTRRWGAWYFAGDFVDNTMDLGSPERAWLLPFRRTTAGCGGQTDETSFWGWYVPIVSRILAARAHDP